MQPLHVGGGEGEPILSGSRSVGAVACGGTCGGDGPMSNVYMYRMPACRAVLVCA